MERISLLHLCDDVGRKSGGLGTSILPLVKSITDEKKNFNISLITKEDCLAISGNHGIRCYTLGNVGFIKTIIKIKRLIKKEKCKADRIFIHCHGPWSMLTLCALIATCGYPVNLILTVHGMFDTKSLQKKKLKKMVGVFAYQIMLYKAFKAIVVNSDLEYKNVRKIMPTANIKIIPHGISKKVARDEKDNRSAFEANEYIFMSRLVPDKGLEETIAALACCEGANIRLLVAGEGEEDYVEGIKDLVRKLNLENNVFFLGYLNETQKEKIFPKVKYLILPSHSENFGMVVLEALAYSVPCIVSKYMPWGMIDRKCGWVVGLGDNSFNLALNESSRMDFKEYCGMTVNAYKLSEKYNWIAVVNRYMLEIYV